MNWFAGIIAGVAFIVYTYIVYTVAKDRGHEEVFRHLDKALLREQRRLLALDEEEEA